MKIFGRTFFEKKEEPKVKADYYSPYSGSGRYNYLFSIYNGEKNLGEIGPITNYFLDYEALRLRSWEAYLTSECAVIALGKHIDWVIGPGLKLQSEPSKTILEAKSIVFDRERFNDMAEALFQNFCDSKTSDYKNQDSLNEIAKEAYKNTQIGGDVLVVIRLIKSKVKIQLIDGAHVQSPPTSSSYFNEANAAGNYIRNGIEMSQSGEHIAYYVCKKGSIFDYERISAKGTKSGKKMAFMVYGRKHRLDNNRGIPLLSSVLESISKLDRYKEATVGSAEERQKIVYQIVHDLNASGENPKTKTMAKAIRVSYDATSTTEIPEDVNGNQLADTVEASTNKQTWNMPPGSKMESLSSNQELSFKDFYTTNFMFFCAAVGIPYEVALSSFNSNYSASRAAIKEWEYKVKTQRKYFSDQFYQPIYNFCLEVWVLKNEIQAPGYLDAAISGDDLVLESYQKCRFVGESVPHIDPVKEVEAVRRKLGSAADMIPLTTVEAATEELAGGDSDSNLEQFALEVEKAKKLKIVQEPKEPEGKPKI